MYLVRSVRKRVFIRGSGREPPPFFFSSFESCVTGSRSYQAFSWFFGPCSLASKENRSRGTRDFPFFQISGIRMFADKDGWKLVSFNVYFIVLRWLRSQDIIFFFSLPCKSLPLLLSLSLSLSLSLPLCSSVFA